MTTDAAYRRLVAQDQKAIGNRIAIARAIREPNRSEFARQIGIDVSTLRYIEAGTRGMSIPMLRLIVHTLRVPWGFVLDGTIRAEDYDVVLMGEIVRQHPELTQPVAADNLRSHKPSNPSKQQPAPHARRRLAAQSA